MILDAEVLLIDTQTSKPLPFGTLGIHKVSSCSLLPEPSPSFSAPSSLTALTFRPSRKRPFRTLTCAFLFSTASTSTARASWRGKHAQRTSSASDPPVHPRRRAQRLLVVCFLRPLCERRKFLHDNMVEVPNRILFSEMKHVTVGPGSAAVLTQLWEQHALTWFVLQRAADLADMITRVIREGLEGLVLKDVKVHLGSCAFVLGVDM